MKRCQHRPLVAVMTLISAFVTACTTQPSGEPSDTLSITIERTGLESWQVTYDVNERINVLNLGPEVGDYRTTSWRPQHGFDLTTTEGGDEIIARTGGKPFDQVIITIQTFDKIVPKNYVPFNVFSDGSVSLYLELFNASTSQNGETKNPPTYITLRPRPGEKVILAGNVYERVEKWPAPNEGSAFVYIGTIVPTESKDLVAVFDPALPDWLKQHFTTSLPKMFAYLGERFERELDTRPAIFVSAIFDPNASGYSYKGGTRPSQIQFRLRGEPINEPNTNIRLYFDKFYAHEGAHLWQDLSQSQNETAWIHEGAADAIALTAVRDLNMWTNEEIEKSVASAKSECASGLSKTALTKAGENGAFGLYYACGLVIAQATERSLKRAGKNIDIVDFHQIYMAERDLARDLNTLENYLSTFKTLGGDTETAALIERIVEERLEDPSALVEALLPKAPKANHLNP